MSRGLRFTYISCRQSAQIELIRGVFSKQSRAASHPPFFREGRSQSSGEGLWTSLDVHLHVFANRKERAQYLAVTPGRQEPKCGIELSILARGVVD